MSSLPCDLSHSTFNKNDYKLTFKIVTVPNLLFNVVEVN